MVTGETAEVPAAHRADWQRAQALQAARVVDQSGVVGLDQGEMTVLPRLTRLPSGLFSSRSTQISPEIRLPDTTK